MVSIALVGYGNLIRKDDAAGLKAIDIIRDSIKKDHKDKSDEIGYFYGYNAVDLLGEFDNYDYFILIDTAMLNIAPGKYIRAEMDEINFSDDTALSHSANFKNLLETARGLGIRPPQLLFYMIQPKELDIGEELSKEVSEGLAKMVKEIQQDMIKIIENN